MFSLNFLMPSLYPLRPRRGITWSGSCGRSPHVESSNKRIAKRDRKVGIRKFVLYPTEAKGRLMLAFRAFSCSVVGRLLPTT